MSQVAEAFISFTVSTDALKSQMDAAREIVIGGVQSMVTVMESMLSRIGGAISEVMGLLELPTSGMGWLTQAISLASQTEQAEIAFGTMLRSMEEGREMVRELQEFAAVTPMTFMGIQQTARTLLQFGTTAEDLIPTIRMLGDVTNGNQDKLNHMALAFAHVQARGTLLARELNMMVYAGFNPLTEMARTSGRHVTEFQNMMHRGQITVEMVTEAFRTASSAGGQFDNAMQRQSQTIAGLWSTALDNIQLSLVEVGKVLIDGLNMKGIINGIIEFSGIIRETLKEIAPALTSIIGPVAGVGAAFLALGLALPTLKLLSFVFLPMLESLRTIAGVVVGIVPAILSTAYSFAAFAVSEAYTLALAAAMGVLRTATFLYQAAVTSITVAMLTYSVVSNLLSAATLVFAAKIVAFIPALFLYYGILGTIATAKLIYAGTVWLVNTAQTALAAVFNVGALKLIAYGLAYAPVIAAKLLYMGVLGLVKLATLAWAAVNAFATGGLSILAGVAAFAAIVIGGVLVAAIGAAISPLLILAGAAMGVVGAVGAIAGLGGLAYLVSFGAAMVSAFRDAEGLGRAMRAAWEEVKSVLLTVGNVFLTAFRGSVFSDVASGWEELRRTAQAVFLAITNWILENREQFYLWSFYIGQIARSAMDLIALAWNGVMRLITSGLGQIVDLSDVSWSDILGTISMVLNYISVGMQNLNLVWDIVVAGFRLAWANISTLSVWEEWKVRAMMIFDEVRNYLVEAFHTAWNAIKSTFLDTWAAIQNTVLQGLAAILRELADAAPAGSVLAGRLRAAQWSATTAGNQALIDRERARPGDHRNEDFEAAERSTAAIERQMELEQRLEAARRGGDRGAVDQAQRELDALLRRFRDAANANRVVAVGGAAGEERRVRERQPPQQEQPQPVTIAYTMEGLTQMWKTMQQDNPQVEMNNLLRESNDIQRDQRDILQRIAGRPAPGRGPARAG
jgi:tape measure domain-containing protein